MEIQIHRTEINQGQNGSDEEALQRLTSTIVQKISEGANKTKSIFSSACIYRVSKKLRTLKESAYTPRLIAIGPLHRDDKHLQIPFQHVKMSYTNHLLSRLTAGIHDLESAEEMKFAAVQECLAKLKTLVDDAKKCYAEEVTLDEEMMLVDGCFILELFYGYCTKTRPETDPIRVALNFFNVKSDLVLLENQIPFIVLEKLFQLTVGRIPDRPNKDWSLTDYVRWCYADKMMPERNSNNSGSAKSTWSSSCDCVLRVFGCTAAAAAKEEEGVQSGKKIDHHRSTAKYYHHILHYLHDGYLPRDQTKQEKSMIGEMPSASELVFAGVKFVPDAGNGLLNFTEPKGLFRWYHRARFVIPPLTIYDETETYLRNLIALEQSCPGIPLHVSSYADVMDMLVNTDKDIQVLEKAGVLINCLGATKDATDLFNKLCKEIVVGQYFSDTCIKATEYSKRFWPKNMAHVRRTYFKSPWTFIAFCVGFIVFIMTVLQFFHDFFNESSIKMGLINQVGEKVGVHDFLKKSG